MNRLNQKCFIASAGIHSLLLLLLFVGPAFVSQRTVPDNLPVLEFIPLRTTDELISGGGNPNARPPAVNLEQPPPAQPVVQPQVVKPAEPEPKPKVEPKRQPEPEPEPVKPPPNRPEPDQESLEIDQKPKPKLPKVSTEMVTRKPSDAEKKARDAKAAEARRREKAAAEARRKIASAIGNLANNLESGLSSSTTIELKGPGGGGVPYANFLQSVKSIYSQAWHVPDGVTDDDATAVADVVIARDGTVLSFKLVKRSGNPQVDRSVESLDRIRRAVPLPDNSSEEKRTVTIEFNVRARRALG